MTTALYSLIGSKNAQGVAQPDAVDLDGTNDYYSRASDLVGNADGKTFTVSGTIYLDDASGTDTIYDNTGNGFRVFVTSNDFRITAENSGGTTILDATVSDAIADKTFYSFQASVDLTNSSNRSIYINDQATSPTWSTYTNDNIDFTKTGHAIGSDQAGTNKLYGRLGGHFFLAYEYIDLSIEANRRIFINEDLTPA